MRLILSASQDIENLAGAPLTDLATVNPEDTIVNNTRPDCAFTTAATAPVTSTFTVNVTCTPQNGWADTIIGFESSDLVLSNASLESFSFTSSTYAGSFVLRPLDSGTVTVDLPADSLYDEASNTNTASTQFSISSDVTVPTVTMNPWSLSPYSGPLTLGITFSESVTGFDPTTDLVLSNATIAVLSSSSRSFTLTVTPTAQGPSRLIFLPGLPSMQTGSPTPRRRSLRASMTPMRRSTRSAARLRRQPSTISLWISACLKTSISSRAI